MGEGGERGTTDESKLWTPLLFVMVSYGGEGKKNFFCFHFFVCFPPYCIFGDISSSQDDNTTFSTPSGKSLSPPPLPLFPPSLEALAL